MPTNFIDGPGICGDRWARRLLPEQQAMDERPGIESP